MGGPWEKYGAAPAAPAGPWQKYGGGESAPPSLPELMQTPAEPGTLAHLGNAGLGAIQGVTAGFGDEISGAANGLADTLLGKGSLGDNYRKWRDLSRGMNERAEKESPKSYLAGNLAGGLAIPTGPSGSALTIGKAALLGAGNALGNSNSDLTTGDTSNYAKAAAQTAGGAALGAGTTYALGKLGRAISPKISGAGENAVSPLSESLTNSANENAVKALNPTGGAGGQMAKIDQTVGVGRLGQALRDQGVVGFGDNAKSISQNLLGPEGALGKAGKSIGQIYKNADATATPDQLLKVADFENALAPVIEKYEGMGATRPIAGKIQDMLDNLKGAYGDAPIPFAQAAKEVSNTQKMAFRTMGLDPSVAQQVGGDAAMAMRGALTDKVGQVLKESGLPEANQLYSTLSAAKKPAIANLAGARSNRAVSLMDTILGTGGAAVGATLGGPIGATMGAAAAGGANHILRQYYRAAAASGYGKLAIGAQYLARAAEAGEPLGTIIQKATALGLPKEVIEALQSSQNLPQGDSP